MKYVWLSILLAAVAFSTGCSKKKDAEKKSKVSKAKAATKNAKGASKGAGGPAIEAKSLKTHCPPRLSLYIKLVTQFEAAAQAKSKGDPKPMAAFGTKAQQVEKMTVGFQKSTLNQYCRGFFNPAVQRFTAASALLASTGAKPAASGAAAQPGAVKAGKAGVKIDPATVKAANKALKAAACNRTCAKVAGADKKAKCLAACKK